MQKMRVGVIGAGMISHVYLRTCKERFAHILEILAVADMLPEAAQRRAEEFSIPRACTVDELLADPDIDIVLNLTAPAAHAPLNLRALHAGKHVYTEKPFALTRADADEVLTLAKSRELRVGCAPDTFLGAGIQTCIKWIDDGWIGQPYAANAVIIMGHAADGAHPNFQNFLKLGGDPLLDMGPYYLTALIAMLGPVRRVSGSATQLRTAAIVRNPASPAFGRMVPVEAPTCVTAVLDFHSGATASLQAAKESFGYQPRLEIFGTEGNLTATDPNMFGGTVTCTSRHGGTRDVPLSHPFAEENRGIGLADMASGIQFRRPHRASGELARHVLDVALAVLESSATGTHVHPQTTVERPAPLPLGLKFNWLDIDL